MHNSDRWAYQATYKIHSHMCNILLKIYTILKIRFLIGLQLHTGFVYKARFFLHKGNTEVENAIEHSRPYL